MIALALLLAVPQDTGRARPDSALPGGVLEPIAVAAISVRPVAPDRGMLTSFQISGLRPGAFLDEALPRVPGVVAQFRGTFALDTRVVIRGAGARSAFGARGVTVLLDGVPQTLPDGQAGLGQVDPATLHRIDVIRGAAGAYYGNGAGGVLMLTTADYAGREHYASFRATGGAHGSRTIGGYGRVRLARDFRRADGLFLSASEVRQDGYRDYSAGVLRHAGAALTLGTDMARTHVRLRISDLARAENPGALDSAQLAANPRQAQARNVAFQAGKQATEWQVSVDRSGLIPRGHGSAMVFAVHRSLDNPLASSWVRLQRSDFGTRLAGEWYLREHWWLQSGIELQRQDDDRRNFANDSGRIGTTPTLDQRELVTSFGMRAAVRRRVLYGTTAVLGARLDHVAFRVDDRLPRDGDASASRAMGAVSFATSIERVRGPWKAGVGLSTAFETPTTTELARPGTGGFSADLAPQRTLQAEASVSFDAERVKAGVTAYRSRVSDALVQREEPTLPGRFYFANAAEARLSGVEADLSVLLRSWLHLSSAVTLTRHTYVRFPTDSTPFDGHAVPGLPRAALSAVLTAARGRGPLGELEIAAQGRTWADDANSAAAAGWTQLNVRAGWRWRRFTAFGGMRNVTDAKVVGSVNVNGALRRFFEPAPGRTVYAGMDAALR